MIVVDASAAVHLLLHGEHEGLVQRACAESQVHAPDIVFAETAAHIRRRELAGAIETGRAEAAIADLVDLVEVRAALQPLLDRAWQMRANLTIPDGLYVALAEARGCPLVTTDERLVRGAAAVSGIEVIRPANRD